MNSEVERHFVEKYPALYRGLQPRWAGSPLFECEDGWREIIESLSSRLEPYAVGTGLSISVVKQKLGELRVGLERGQGVAGTAEESLIERAIREATEQSRSICESCGSPGQIRSKGRLRDMRALCMTCASSRGYVSA